MELQIQHELEHDFPTTRAARGIYDEQALHRAVEAYRFFYPTVSCEALFAGLRALGIEDSRHIAILQAAPRHLIFTANSDTPYGSATLDLAELGPMVIELPPGPFIGLVDDHHQGWVLDLGIPGPDRGEGGRHLVLPPSYAGDVPIGYHTAFASTTKVLLALRVMPQRGNTKAALEALRRVKVYPLDSPTALLEFVDITDRPHDTTPLRWEGNLEFWRRLHAVIDQEPVLDEMRAMYGQLAALGIEKGHPFQPDARTRSILEISAKMALDEMRVEAFASQRPDCQVWEDRRWEWVGLVPDAAGFESHDFLDLEARDRWFFQAVATSPAMFRRHVGSGSIYFLGVRDSRGAYLDGSNTYRFRIPLPVPAKLFWSVTAYDARTRSQVQAPQDKAVLGSLQGGFSRDADGAVTLYFGPNAPAGKEAQWLQTVPDKGYFLYFRIYGPEAEALDGRWRLGDLEPIAVESTEPEPPSRMSEAIASISTPDSVQTRAGTLQFEAGMPTPSTVNQVYDQLDHLHALESFLGGYAAVSLQAMRKGFLDAGVQDDDVLLFSSLMDCRSLFLTANCDTVYFFSFIDLSKGPKVLEVPPQSLGVLDDMWFRWVSDFGTAGPDRGAGGVYLLVPPGYTGPLPEGGFIVCRSSTERVLMLGRAFLEDDDPAPAAARIRHGVRIYSYVPGGYGSSIASLLKGEGSFAQPTRPRATRFIEGTGLELNTIPPNDRRFYDLLDAAVQAEPSSALEPEIAGHFLAIGIGKGKSFRPDKRMGKLLDGAAALASACARTVALRPRKSEGFAHYEDDSAWMNPLFVGGYEFQRQPPLVTKDGVRPFPDPGARTLHARFSFFYLATGITPAMCMRLAGIGSQYLAAFLDREGQPLDGGSSYRITLPPNIPAALFWSLTLYDCQTRSMLVTPQRYPRAGSQAYPTPAALKNGDGSTTIYIGPERPTEIGEGNYIQTMPGQAWFVALRLYSPLASFFDRTWKPSELERID